MGRIREDIVEGIESETKPIFYKFKNQKGWFKRKKIKFLIKPILDSDLITKEVTKEALKEMATGQTIEEASRIAAENFKKKFIDMGKDSAFKMLIEKGLVYPKIVEKEANLKDDEVPYSLLTLDMKIFIIEELKKISPIFQG